MKKLTLLALSAALALAGCSTTGSAPADPAAALAAAGNALAQAAALTGQAAALAAQASNAAAQAGDAWHAVGGRAAPAGWRGGANAAAVVCGLTRVDPAAYGGWSGDCPGTDTDARVFALACAGEGVPCTLLLDAQCTAAGIEAAARRAAAPLAPGGLLVLYYSGHGGQVPDPSDPSESDGRSETLCLWDGPLTDNVVWSLLSRVPAGVRVWMVTDSCHSGTNYRAPRSYAPALRARGGGRVPDLLHWGGCADGEYSYGTSQGGTFTTALVDAYSPGQSYAGWFAAAARLMPRTQRPTREHTGADFSDRPAFR